MQKRKTGGADVEITPEMVDRGVWALLTFTASEDMPAEDGLRDILHATFAPSNLLPTYISGE